MQRCDFFAVLVVSSDLAEVEIFVLFKAVNADESANGGAVLRAIVFMTTRAIATRNDCVARARAFALGVAAAVVGQAPVFWFAVLSVPVTVSRARAAPWSTARVAPIALRRKPCRTTTGQLRQFSVGHERVCVTSVASSASASTTVVVPATLASFGGAGTVTLSARR